MRRTIHQHTRNRIEQIVGIYKEEVWEELNRQYMLQTGKSDILADNIAKFGGSWRFIIFFASVLVMWVIWNSLPITRQLHFDQYPFILLNLILSVLAAFQAPIIMMSQNRQATRDKEEFRIDHALNFNAEKSVLDIQTRLKSVRVANEKVLQMNNRYQNKLEELKAESEKSTTGLIEKVAELKNSLEKQA